MAKKSTKSAIPYEFVYDDGMIEAAGGRFSIAYTLGDINFETSSDQEQLRIFHSYKDLLTGLDDNVSFQIVIHNMRENSKVDILKKVSYRPLRDGLNDYRSYMNAMIAARLRKGKNGLRQTKYMVLSTKETDTERAKMALENAGANVVNSVKRISPRLDPVKLSSEARLRSLFDIYNQDGTGVFENAKSKDGDPVFSFRQLAKRGRTTKDAIAPSGMDLSSATFFQIGDAWGRTLFLDDIPPRLSTSYLQELANINCSSIISIHYVPVPLAKAMKMVKNNITALDAEADARKGSASESLRQAREGSLDLMKDFVNRQQKPYDVTMTVTLFAETKEKLFEYSEQVSTLAKNKQAPLRVLFGQQLEGLNTSLPLGEVHISEHKLLTTESAAVFLPFTSLELEQLYGLNYGTNEISKNQIFYNRLSNKNYNCLVIAKSGGGKSANVKLEMLQALLRSKKNYVHIIDPKGEYGDFARLLGGEVITFSPTSNTFLNPFDMDISFDSDTDPLGEKCDYILGMIEIMQHGKPLDPKENSVVDRCVRSIYRGYIEHMEKRHTQDPSLTRDRDAEALPTMKDLYYELLRQKDREAENIAKTIEMYAVGGMQLFSNRTNVDTTGRLIVYDVHRLGTGTKNLGLYVCINEMRNATIENKKNGDWTWMYIDEMQTVMGSETSTKPLANIWETVRQFNGVPTGILQNTNNILATVEGRNIINNTNTMIILDTGTTDRTNLVNFLQLSETEADHISNAERGHGLFCAGSLRIPFNNWVDPRLYPEIFELIKTP